MTTTDVGGWAPAPGSVARQSWPASVRWAWWLLHRPALCAALAALAAVAVTAGAAAAVVLVGVTAAVLVGWWLGHPASFHPTAGRVLLGIWRSAWAYGVRWRTVMMLSGLGGRFDGGEFLPRVVRVRAGRNFDRVRVRIVAGQQPEDWARRADALAHAFGARSCQVTALAGRPGCVELAIGRRDPLAAVVPALTVLETVDLDGVPVGVTEAGEPWRLSVAGGAHTLLAGCTGSGKGSVV